MFSGLTRAAGSAGVGVVLKQGADGGLYVKSVVKEGPCGQSGVVVAGDLLLQGVS
jgi:C-terminal processing protease CtpA/Prc